MTRLNRNVSREVRGELIITLAPEGIYTREKGRRTAYGPIAYGRLHQRLADERALQIIKERKAARQAKKGGR